MEKQIDKLEKEQKHLDEKLADPEQFQELSRQKGFFEKYKQNQQELSEMVQVWENTMAQLDRRKSKF